MKKIVTASTQKQQDTAVKIIEDICQQFREGLLTYGEFLTMIRSYNTGFINAETEGLQNALKVLR